MSSKRSGSYSPVPSVATGDAVVIPQSALTVKNVFVIFTLVLVCLVVALVAAIALGIVGLKRPTSSAPLPTTSTPATATPTQAPQLVTKVECGSGQWKRIAFFNMSDPSQQCPRGWRGYDPATTNGVRCCGRPVTDRSSCPSVFYGTSGYQYSHVCGRATGYQQGSPDGFASIVNAEPSTETVNGIYVDGVSVTYGNPRTHIWTFAVGLHEYGTSSNAHNCPCDGGAIPPTFVGNNYFCETGDDTPDVQLKKLIHYGMDLTAITQLAVTKILHLGSKFN